MSVATLFCANCGAANQPQALRCFACQQPLAFSSASAVALASETSSARMVKQRYRLVRQVGTGGFGAVYLAEDTFANQQPVALKCINMAGLKPQEMIEATDAFNREVSLLPGLRHTSLPRVYDHFTDPEHWYLVMEFIEGETLETYVQKMPGERLPVEMVLDMGIRLAEVLHYLHSRQPPLIFRDLKPANIMRTPGGNLYLIDFGIARVFKPGQARDTIAFGSPGYAPPEQYGKAQTTPRADLYSLGATLHALLSGSDPANSPFAFAPLTLSSQPAIERLERLIGQMVELDASKRPASARVVKEELQEIVTELLRERLRVLYPVDTQTKSFVQPYVPSPTTGNGWQQGQIQIGLSAQAASAARRGKSRRRFIRLSAGMILASAVSGGAIQLLSSFSDHSEPPSMGSLSDASSIPYGKGALGTTYYTYTGHSNFVSSVAWSPDGNYIVSSGYDFTAQVIRAFPATLIHTYKEPLRAPVLAVAWSSDSQYIASVAGSTIWIWHALTGSAVMEYKGHSEQVNAISWSPDGRYVASAAENVQVWDVQTGNHLSTYNNHLGGVSAVAWSPDSKYIVSGGKDGTAHVWQPFLTTDTLMIYQKHVDQVNCVSWSLDSLTIASGGDSKDMAVHVWYASSGETLHVQQNKRSAIRALAFSPATMRIASTGDDDSVQIWDADDGQGPFAYQNDSDVVTSISWSPDGNYIVSGSADSNVQVWQAV